MTYRMRCNKQSVSGFLKSVEIQFQHHVITMSFYMSLPMVSGAYHWISDHMYLYIYNISLLYNVYVIMLYPIYFISYLYM